MSATPELHAVESTDPLAVPRRVALVRPDTRPAVRRIDERYVMTFPHLIVREVILFQVVVIALSLAAVVFDAPLEGIANPIETPNPAKAPWYFLGPAGASSLLPADRRRRPPAGPRRPLARRDSLRADQPHRRAALGVGRQAHRSRPRRGHGRPLHPLRRLRLLGDRRSDAPDGGRDVRGPRRRRRRAPPARARNA